MPPVNENNQALAAVNARPNLTGILEIRKAMALMYGLFIGRGIACLTGDCLRQLLFREGTLTGRIVSSPHDPAPPTL
jgi:hypothetical protein